MTSAGRSERLPNDIRPSKRRLKWGCMTWPKNVAGDRGKGRTAADRRLGRDFEKEKRAMKTTEHSIEDSKDIENMHHMRLMTLLQELVRDKGFKGAARVLELDQRTVAECARTGQVSRRVRQALERALRRASGRLRHGSGSATTGWRTGSRLWKRGMRRMRRGTTRWARRCTGVWPPSRAGSKPCVGTGRRGPGPVMPAPVPPRRRAVRRTLEGSLRRGPGCGGNTQTS